MSNVTQWPKAFVGEAVVIAFFFLLGEPDPAQCVPWFFGRNREAVMPVNGLTIGVATTMCYPCSVTSAKYRLQRRH
jgi:hypothetical protein